MVQKVYELVVENRLIYFHVIVVNIIVVVEEEVVNEVRVKGFDTD